MAIKEYTLGSGTKSDRDLYAWIGHWLVDPEMVKTIGTCITSTPGDRWMVMQPAKGPARGFAVTRDIKTESKRHLRYIHADTSMARQTLIARVVETAKADGIAWLWARERRGDKDLPKAGFKMAEIEARGEFVRWDMMLGDDA